MSTLKQFLFHLSHALHIWRTAWTRAARDYYGGRILWREAWEATAHLRREDFQNQTKESKPCKT